LDKLIPVYIDTTRTNNRIQVNLEEVNMKSEKVLFFALPFSTTKQGKIFGIWKCEAVVLLGYNAKPVHAII